MNFSRVFFFCVTFKKAVDTGVTACTLSCGKDERWMRMRRSTRCGGGGRGVDLYGGVEEEEEEEEEDGGKQKG